MMNGKDVFSAQISALQAMCMWPTTENPLGSLMAMCRYWLMCGILAGCTIGLTFTAVEGKNMVVRSEGICIMTLTLTALYRMLFYKGHHAEIEGILNKGVEFAKDNPLNWSKRVPELCRTYYVSGAITVIIWIAAPFLNYWSGQPLGLPLKILVPPDLTGWSYAFLYSMSGAAAVIATFAYLTADSLFFTLIHVANGSLQHLRGELLKIKRVSDEVSKTDRKRHFFLKECVKKHQKILNYLRTIDGLYRSNILADVLHAIISLSFGILALSEAQTVFDSSKMGLFLVLCVLHQYLNSFFGEKLVQQQDNLVADLKDVPWHECSNEFRKTYHIVLCACRTPIKLSAWTMYYLEYKSFAEVCPFSLPQM